LGIIPPNSEDEFLKYLAEPQINHNDDSCLWWKSRELTYPFLSVLAKNILCIPASSAPSERVFSTAGSILIPKRNRMTPFHLSALVYLNKNI